MSTIAETLITTTWISKSFFDEYVKIGLRSDGVLIWKTTEGLKKILFKIE